MSSSKTEINDPQTQRVKQKTQAFLDKIHGVRRDEEPELRFCTQNKPGQEVIEIQSEQFYKEGQLQMTLTDIITKYLCCCIPLQCMSPCLPGGIAYCTMIQPVIWVLSIVLPIESINNSLTKTFVAFISVINSIFDIIYQPVKIGKFGLKCAFHIALLVVILLSSTGFAIVQHGAVYYVSIPATDQFQQIQFTPRSLAIHNNQNSNTQQQYHQPQYSEDILHSTILFKAQEKFRQRTDITISGDPTMEEMAKIKLNKEKYEISLQLEVAENMHNMEQGNLYLTTSLVPCDQNFPIQVLKRMGHFQYKSQSELLVKELIRMIPFAKRVVWLYSKEAAHDKQMIDIPISTEIDNDKKQLCRIEVQLSNKNLQFSKAHLKFNSILTPYSIRYGYRYFMREWFWCCFIISIAVLSLVNAFTIFFTLFIFGCVPIPCIRKDKED